MMDEPKLVKKSKIDFNYFKKNVYLFVAGLLILIGTSYSLTFFIQNKKIGEISLTVGDLTYTVTSDRSINISNVSNLSDSTGLMNYSKTITVTNNSSRNGILKLKLNRTSGVELEGLRYGIYVNNILINVGNVPNDGILYDSVILENEVTNFEVSLWLKDNYTSSSTTFEGDIEPLVSLDSKLGTAFLNELTDLDNNYVSFNNETWRIKGIENGRIILTQTAYLSNTFTNSNLYDSSVTLSSEAISLVTSMSDDNHALYLRKTVMITGGNGTSENPYILSNGKDTIQDRKVIGYITYNDGVNNISPAQPIYYEETNYVGKLDDLDFVGWSDNADGTGNNYNVGDIVNFSANKTLYAKYDKSLYNVLKRAATIGTYAREYIGNHQDSMDSTKSTETIYHWYGDSDANGAAINNMNNVVFGNQCWKMIRTMDTGGVKLLYNGEPTITGSGANTSYDCGTTRSGKFGEVKLSKDLTGSWRYAASYTTSVSGDVTTYTLTTPRTVSINSGSDQTITTSTINNIVNNYPYTCGNTSDSCTTLYRVDSFAYGTSAYVYTNEEYFDANGYSEYNLKGTSISDVGYMYNSRYDIAKTSISDMRSMLISITLNSTKLTNYGTYMYADSFTLSGTTHVLTNPESGSNLASFPNDIVGKYTCLQNSASSCSIVYYITNLDTSGTNPIVYYLIVSPGKDSSDAAYRYLFSTGVEPNSDGTFTMTGTVEEIYQKDWYTKYNGVAGKYVCYPGHYTYSNGTYKCRDNGIQRSAALGYVVSSTSTSSEFSIIYKYGFGITSDSGSYSLVDSQNVEGSLQYIINWGSINTSNCFANQGDVMSNCGWRTLGNSHYTCFNLTGKCNTYYYIPYTTSMYAKYVAITGGKYVSTDITDSNNILHEMLYKSDVNTYDSSIKTKVESWYRDNLYDDFDDYIEDTIYCNNRTITDFSTWNPNGVSPHNGYAMLFKESSLSTDLSCPRLTDMFSVGNTSAHLNYKVGLLSRPEMELLNNANARSSKNLYWLISPNSFVSANPVEQAIMRSTNSNGNIQTNYVFNTTGVKPSISLIPNIEYTTGDGSTSNPYVVKLENS